jgi:hypothetical protein
VVAHTSWTTAQAADVTDVVALLARRVGHRFDVVPVRTGYARAQRLAQTGAAMTSRERGHAQCPLTVTPSPAPQLNAGLSS